MAALEAQPILGVRSSQLGSGKHQLVSCNSIPSSEDTAPDSQGHVTASTHGLTRVDLPPKRQEQKSQCLPGMSSLDNSSSQSLIPAKIPEQLAFHTHPQRLSMWESVWISGNPGGICVNVDLRESVGICGESV